MKREAEILCFSFFKHTQSFLFCVRIAASATFRRVAGKSGSPTAAPAVSASAPDALGPALFGLVDISCRSCNHNSKNCNNYKINHTEALLLCVILSSSQRILNYQSSVGPVDQRKNDRHNCQNHSQTRNKTCPHSANRQQRTNLIHQIGRNIARGEL